MSWLELPDEVRETAEGVLTAKQLDVWKLWLNGMGTRRIATMLGVTPTTIKDHLHATHHRLRQAGVKRTDEGNYHLEEAA